MRAMSRIREPGMLTMSMRIIFASRRPPSQPLFSRAGRSPRGGDRPCRRPLSRSPEDAAPLRLGHLDRQSVRGIVEVPVRIVGGEQHAVPAHPVDRIRQMLRGSGSSTGCVVNQTLLRMYSDGTRFRCGSSRRSFANCRSIRQAMRRRPGEAGLDQHHLQRREAFEHALEDQAGQHRLLACAWPTISSM